MWETPNLPFFSKRLGGLQLAGVEYLLFADYLNHEKDADRLVMSMPRQSELNICSTLTVQYSIMRYSPRLFLPCAYGVVQQEVT
jgi:hypothetical protein